MTTTALEVLNRTTGELLDLREADDERLATWVDDAAEIRERLNEEEALVSAELVARLDKSASWTRRVGDPDTGRQFEITAPSPNAGAVAYLTDRLREELRGLVDRGTISAEGAEGALDRLVVVTVRVGLEADLTELARALEHSVDTEIAGVNVRVVKADPVEKAKVAGIKALRKVPGTGAALDRASVQATTGPRRAKVKVIRRG